MAWKRRRREDQREALFGIRDIRDGPIDHRVGTGYKWLLVKPTRGSSKTHIPRCRYGDMTLMAFMRVIRPHSATILPAKIGRYTGKLSCFLAGISTFLPLSIPSARASRLRVARGMITSSI